MYSGPPGWGLCSGLTTHSRKKTASHGNREQYINQQLRSWKNRNSIQRKYDALQSKPTGSCKADDSFSPDSNPKAVITEDTNPVGNVECEDAPGNGPLCTGGKGNESVPSHTFGHV